MDTNEKLGLIERVDHASEDQAKRALKSMILKCTVRNPTIARAIKDAVERHLPTPLIVYRQPESGGDEAESTSSHRGSNEDKNDQDGSSQNEEDVPSETSRKHPRTRRGDINPNPFVEQLLLAKTKTKLKSKKKRGGDHDERLISLAPSKTNKSKHGSRLRAGNEQRTSKSSMGKPDDKEKPTVIDLITSSDDDTSDEEHSGHESSDSRNFDEGEPQNNSSGEISSSESSDGDTSDRDTSDDGNSSKESSGDGESGNEEHDNALAAEAARSRENSKRKATDPVADNDDDGYNAAPSITHNRADRLTQNGGMEMSSTGLGKKRKAPELSEEEIHGDGTAQSATDAQVKKKFKRHQPQEQQIKPKDRTCRQCGILFPSMRQLLGHQPHCKSAIATPASYHYSARP